MKKYLMSGMAALALAFVATSCNDKELYDPNYNQAKEDFKNDFVAYFGTPASNQNWGFDNVEVITTSTPATARTTRGHNVNRNEWADKFDVPANVTENERNLVVAEFSKQRIGAVNEENVNWADYFIYEVFKGTAEYKDGFGNSLVGSDKMNHLQVKFGDEDVPAGDNAAWEHANDFNNGDHNSSWGTIKGATLMLNSGTKDFAYHNTADSKYHTEYIIIAGADIDESLAGFYYVGFDFYATHPEGQEANKNMDVERDWIFNDWIVRISPAKFKNARRIIAEDLASNQGSDFDYNDVVFDIAYTNDYFESDWSNKLVAHITLQAAGAELPIYIAGKEVHELFGVPAGTMVNTGLNSRPVVSFSVIVGPADWNHTFNPNDIEVNANGKILGTEVGAPSEKLCVGTDFNWCAERENIGEKYAKFTEWVTNKSVKWY